jgi:hypothetical protein
MEPNIKMGLKELNWEGTECIDLAQDMDDKWQAGVNAVMNLQFSWNSGNFLTGFSGRTVLYEVPKGTFGTAEVTDRVDSKQQAAGPCTLLPSVERS